MVDSTGGQPHEERERELGELRERFPAVDRGGPPAPPAHGELPPESDERQFNPSAEVYRQLFANAKIGLLRTRFDDGLVLACNDRMAWILGYSGREELQGKVFTQDLYVDPNARRRVVDQLRRTGEVRGSELQFRRKDGSFVWLRTSVELSPQNGWIEGIAEDITDRIEAEHALKESEERLRAIFETARDYVFVKDRNLRYTHANPAMAELFGRPVEQIVGATDGDLFDESTARRVRAVDEKVLAGSVEEESNASVIRGATHHFHSVKVPLRSSGGEVIGLCGIARDVTALKRSELVERAMASILHAAASASDLRALISRIRDLLEGLIDTTNFFVALFDEGTGCYSFPYYADEFDELERYEPEPLPKSLTDFVRRSGKPLFLDEAGFSDLEQTGEVELVGTDSKQWLGVPLSTDAGVIGVVVVQSYQDPDLYTVKDLELLDYAAKTISIAVERKQAEDERRALGARVLRGQKMESLGVLAGGIAHEFNNRLQSILGSAGLAGQMLPGDSPIHHQIRAIEKAADSAAELTRQMLSYAGKGRFIVEDVDLSAQVEDVARYLPATVADDVEIRYDLSRELPPITADAAEIRQMVSNLVTNAVEAVEGMPGHVVVRTWVERISPSFLRTTILGEDLPPGEYVILEVADTGAGMDADTVARIFDPFFSTKFTGRGLGLAAVIGIVRENRGAIRVDSEPGMGTSVRILLPTEGGGVSRQQGRQGSAETADGPLSVMVVDDDDAIRSLTVEMLEQVGIEATQAADGVEALDRIRRAPQSVDVVLLDMTMPRMSGEETFQALKSIRPELPVIVASGYSEQDTMQKFGEPAPAGFLQKPYRLKDLVSALERACGGSI